MSKVTAIIVPNSARREMLPLSAKNLSEPPSFYCEGDLSVRFHNWRARKWTLVFTEAPTGGFTGIMPYCGLDGPNAAVRPKLTARVSREFMAIYAE
jgi:hypothetical protein